MGQGYPVPWEHAGAGARGAEGGRADGRVPARGPGQEPPPGPPGEDRGWGPASSLRTWHQEETRPWCGRGYRAESLSLFIHWAAKVV